MNNFNLMQIVFLIFSLLYFLAFLLPEKIKLPGHCGDASFFGRVLIKRFKIVSNRQKLVFDRVTYALGTIFFLIAGLQLFK